MFIKREQAGKMNKSISRPWSPLRFDMKIYNAVKEKMDTGDYLHWSSPGIVGWTIETISGGTGTHSSLVLRFEEFNNLKDRRFTMEAMGSGADINLLSERLENFKGDCWWYPLKPVFDERRECIAEQALLYSARAYDYKGLLSNIFGHVSADYRKLLCSEYCYLCWLRCGIIRSVYREAPRPADIPERFKELFLAPIMIKRRS